MVLAGHNGANLTSEGKTGRREQQTSAGRAGGGAAGMLIALSWGGGGWGGCTSSPIKGEGKGFLLFQVWAGLRAEVSAVAVCGLQGQGGHGVLHPLGWGLGACC